MADKPAVLPGGTRAYEVPGLLPEKGVVELDSPNQQLYEIGGSNWEFHEMDGSDARTPPVELSGERR